MSIEESMNELHCELYHLNEQLVYYEGSSKYPEGADSSKAAAKEYLASARRIWRYIERDALKALRR